MKIDDDGDDGISYLCQRPQGIIDDTNNTWITNGEDCKDLEPTTEIYNLLIDVYSHAKTTSSSTQGVEIAETILEKLEDSAMSDGDVELPSPDMDTYLSVMSGCVKHDNFEKIHSLFQRLKRFHHHIVK